MVKMSAKKFSIPPTFKYYWEKPASLNACLPLSPNPIPFFMSNFIKFHMTQSTIDLIQLIKYNGFQISRNKPDETPYVML